MNLEKKGYEIRKLALEGIYNAGSGHPGGSLSEADILAVLYFDEMNLTDNDNRDRFVLSKGHACPGLYAALAIKGFFDKNEMKNLRQIDSFLEGHPSMHKVPGIDMSTGSLGQGLSVSNGMALAGKLDDKYYRVYAIIGDGEIEEGQIWEAAMTSAHYKLDNLCVFLDRNGLQIDGKTKDVMNSDSAIEKFKAFGWNVLEIDGHNISEIKDALKKAKETKGKPTMIVANTIKGKGVSYMENDYTWHGKAPNDEEYKKAIMELDNIIKSLEVK